MSQPSLRERLGITTGKSIAIAVLLSVLIGVVVMQTGTAPGSAPRLESSGRTTKVATPIVNSDPRPPLTRPSSGTGNQGTPERAESQLQFQDASRSKFSKPTPWKPIALPTAVAYDPFALPPTLRPRPLLNDAPLPVVTEAAQPAIETVGTVDPQPSDVEREAALANEAAAEALRKQQEQKRLAREQREQKLLEECEQLAMARLVFDQNVAQQRKRVIEKIRNLQDAGVGIVMVSARSRVVQIDGVTYGEGDEFDDIRIVRINPDGTVVLESAFIPPEFTAPQD